MNPTITGIDDERNPDRDEYERFIDVWWSNGTRTRHVVDEHGQYIEQAFHSSDQNTVWDDFLIETEFDPQQLDEYVVVWLDVKLDKLQRDELNDWSTQMIRENGRGSASNVRYE